MAKLQGIAGMSDATRAFVQTVRLFMRDFGELNRIVAGEESGDRFIGWAVADALSRFNGTPHFTNFSLEEVLNRHLQHLLLRMTVESLLESVGQLQTRNHINYSDGGINVAVNDKTPLIQNWLQYFKASTEQRLTQAKVAINIESLLDGQSSGLQSELWLVNASYQSY